MDICQHTTDPRQLRSGCKACLNQDIANLNDRIGRLRGAVQTHCKAFEDSKLPGGKLIVADLRKALDDDERTDKADPPVQPKPCYCQTWAYDPTVHGDWDLGGHHPYCGKNPDSRLPIAPKRINGDKDDWR